MTEVKLKFAEVKYIELKCFDFCTNHDCRSVQIRTLVTRFLYGSGLGLEIRAMVLNFCENQNLECLDFCMNQDFGT